MSLIPKLPLVTKQVVDCGCGILMPHIISDICTVVVNTQTFGDKAEINTCTAMGASRIRE